MAEVFLAQRSGPGGVAKQVVIKRIRRDVCRDPRYVNLFLTEAKISLSLTHKNIVPVFDFGRASGELFLVMDYVSGCDLATALECGKDRTDKLQPWLAAFIASEACQALDYAHNNGLVAHRDVTPRNILISRSGEVKLVDFGIAQEAAGKRDRRVSGTPAYMSPEQACGQASDARSDVFSLGLVLWELLAGARAYRATDEDSVLQLAQRARVESLPPHVPQPLAAVVERATAEDPADRYDDAHQMQIELEGYLVATRAQSLAASPPLGSQLADWFGSLGLAERKSINAARDTDAAQAVTFIDDGLAKLEEPLQPSTSATVMQPENGDVAGRSLRRSWWAVGAAGAACVSLVVLGLSARGKDIEELPGDVTRGARGVAQRTPSFAGASTERGENQHEAEQMLVEPTAEVEQGQEPDAGAKRAALKANNSPPRSDLLVKQQRPLPPKKHAGLKTPKKNIEDPETGVVKISSDPWASVRVVGRSEHCDDTPCALTLPPGEYVLDLSNPVAAVSKRVTVNIVADREAEVQVVLRAPRGSAISQSPPSDKAE